MQQAAKATYHHGNLKAALIDEARRRVRVEGHEEVSTRACAKAAGVAPSAVFRHFPTKRHLMTAVAVRGYRDMRTEVERRQTRAGPHPAAQLRGLAEGYLTYALKEPRLFRLMFRGEAINLDDAELQEAATALGLTKDLHSFGLPKTEGDILSWAVVHGLATLAIDSQLEDVLEDDVDDRVMQLLPLIRHMAPVVDRLST